MKRFAVLIGAALIGLFGYQVAYPKIFDPTFFSKDSTAPVKAPSAPVETSAMSPPKTSTPQEQTEQPQPAVKPAGPTAAPAPMVMTTPVVEDPDAFHVPVFAPLEDLVKNWTAIPKQAFPRQVRLRRGVEFVMPNGKSQVGAGGTVTVLDQQGGKLIVAPTENSPARSQVALEDTDLNETLRQAYDTWKAQMTAYRRQQWEALQKAPLSKDTSAPPAVVSNDKPVRNPDGTYPVLLHSMKTGQVTEVTPTNIKSWGEARMKKIDGKDYWVVAVEVTVPTLFGPIDSVAEARIRNGKVEKWIYTNSGEVVP